MITVNAGGNFQAALDTAPIGETIALEAGATFSGNYTASRSDLQITGAATLRTQNSLPALRTIGNAARWHFADVTFAAGTSGGPIVQLGDGLINTEAGLPRDFAFDRCAFAADQTAKNGLEMNAAGVTLRHCTVRGVKVLGQESHALIAWNTPGPILVEDCTIEAGSCGFFLGGAKPAITGCIPSDITFRRNLVTRPLEMRALTGYGVKNLFEIKNARRVLAAGNIFERNWADGQAGWSIVLTVRANALDAPWTTIADVTFTDNIVRDVCAGFNILGLDNQRIPAGTGPIGPSVAMDGVTIHNNLVLIDRWAMRGPRGEFGNGAAMQIAGGPRNLAVLGNTFLGNGNILNLVEALTGFRYEGNITRKAARMAHPVTGDPVDTYGMYGDAAGEGNPAFARYCPDAAIQGNVLAGCAPAVYSTRPANMFPSLAALDASFADPAHGNYRSLGAIAGCDQDAIETAQQPPPCTFAVSPLAVELPESGLGLDAISVSRTSVGTCVGDFTVTAIGVPWLSAAEDYATNTVDLVAEPNPSTEPRVGTVTIAGQVVTVTQAGAAPPPPPPPTTAEIIDRVCATAQTTYALTGGDVSPQAAASDAIECVRTALQLRLVP